MKEFWNERYSRNEYVYGKIPNNFFAQQLHNIPQPGKLLLPMEGEGRNAVFAASLGWQVDAMDYADEGRAKAMKLADQLGVSFNYSLGDVTNYSFGTNLYDVVGLIFAHLPQAFRYQIHSKLQNALKPGGLLILEAFHKTQLGKASGGPKDFAMLYDDEILLHDFNSLEILSLKQVDTTLHEGAFHSGEASVIRMVGRKK